MSATSLPGRQERYQERYGFWRRTCRAVALGEGGRSGRSCASSSSAVTLLRPPGFGGASLKHGFARMLPQVPRGIFCPILLPGSMFLSELP